MRFLLKLQSLFPAVRFFKGKENLWAHNKNWKLPTWNFCRPLRVELVRLISTGIYQFWRYWLRDRQYIVAKLKYEHNARPMPLSLGSNAAFVFVILSLGLSVSIVVLLTEKFVLWFQNYEFRKNFRIILQRSINCFSIAVDRCIKIYQLVI